MGIFDKVVRYGEELAGAFPKTEVGRVLSPLELFNKDQLVKLNRLVESDGSAVKKMGQDYFAGKTIQSISDDGLKYTEPKPGLGRARKIVAGAALGLGAANLLGINPGGLTDKANNLASLGMHYTLGRTLMAKGGNSRIAGIGYLGLTAFNAFREGDNEGPM